MEVRLLGPVEVRIGDRRLELGPAKQRAVLAMLALRAGQPVAVDQLVAGGGARRRRSAHSSWCSSTSRGCAEPWLRAAASTPRS